MNKVILIISIVSYILACDCDENAGMICIDGGCYFEADIRILEDFIEGSEGSINMILDNNNNNNIEPLELCTQNWENGRLTLLDCNPIIINNQYNWINISGEIPNNITDWNYIQTLLMPYNDLSGLVPEHICDLNLDFGNSASFDLHSNELCPPYPECVEDYMGSQSNWGTGSCEVSNCYDVGIEEVAIVEFNGDNILNTYFDSSGEASILVNVHNDGPDCSQYPGLMITTETEGVSFPFAGLYEDSGEFINWWYAIFSDDTYFSNIPFEVSPYVPVGTEINFEIKAVTMGCDQDECIEDPYCHDCPMTPTLFFSITVGSQFPNMIGDANIDGILDILDIVFIVDYILTSSFGSLEGNQLFITLIDINHDYNINILDIIKIVDLILNN